MGQPSTRAAGSVSDGATDSIRAQPPAVASGPGRDAGTVTVRYFAAARAAAGTTEEQVDVPPTPAGAACTVGDVLDAVVQRHGPELARVLQRCSYLLDEVAVHGRGTPVADGQVVDVLPPFAGG